MKAFFENLSIKGKIFSLIGTIFGLLGLFAVFQLREVTFLEKNDVVSNIKISMLEANQNEKIFVASRDIAYAKKVSLALERLDSLIEPYKNDGTGKAIFDATAEYKKSFSSMENSNSDGKTADSIYSGKLEPLVDTMMYDAESASEAASKLKQLIMILTLIGSVSVAYYIARIITRSVDKLAKAANKIHAGDYSVQIDIHSKDEFGKLAATFNAMVEKIEMQVKYLENLPTPVMIVDLDMNVTYMNKIGAQITGNTPESCLNKKCFSLFKTDHCNTAECRVRQAINQKAVISGETIARPQGSDINIMYTAAPIADRSGKLVGALEFVADISEMKEAQNYLARCTNNLLTEMDKFANCDLTVKVIPEKEDDEIGRLFHGFNQSVQNIREIVKSVTEAVEATASASHQISSSSEQMAAGVQEQSSQTSEVAAAIGQMTQTILDSSLNASGASEAVKQAGLLAKEGGKVVTETIEGMNRIAQVVKQSSETVLKLGKSSDQIGEIVQVIDDIADQTNLLALNAAIEAARAGEQGRGFAVVADEVRKLAERTTKATKEIAGMILQIQKDTSGAVISMQQGTKEVEKGKDAADKAGHSLTQIIQSSEDVVDLVTKIAAAGEEQSTAAEQISKNIDGINNVTHESASGIQQIAKASEDLSILTTNLQNLVLKFKTDNTRTHNTTPIKPSYKKTKSFV